MERINFTKEKIPFTQIANGLLNDRNLSAKAKGLYAYLYSKPDGWDFAIDRIARDFADGRKAINSGLQELEKTGYLQRERLASGRVAYLLKSQMPEMDIRETKPHAQNGQVPKRPSAETGTVSNKEVEVIKSTSNKEVVLHQFYGELNNVELLPDEHQKLTEKLGAETLAELIEDLSLYIPNKPGKKYSSHYAVLCQWSKRKSKESVRGRKTVSFIG